MTSTAAPRASENSLQMWLEFIAAASYASLLFPVIIVADFCHSTEWLEGCLAIGLVIGQIWWTDHRGLTSFFRWRWSPKVRSAFGAIRQAMR